MNIDYEIIEEPTYIFQLTMTHRQLGELIAELAEAEEGTWMGNLLEYFIDKYDPDEEIDEPTAEPYAILDEQIQLGDHYVTRDEFVSRMARPQPPLVLPNEGYKTQSLEEFLEEHGKKPSGADIVGQLLQKLKKPGLSDHAPSPVQDTIEKLIKGREEVLYRIDNDWLDDGEAHR